VSALFWEVGMKTNVELVEAWICETELNLMELAVVKDLLWKLKTAVKAGDLGQEADCYEDLVKFLVLERGYS
jgi:hypothetical protein